MKFEKKETSKTIGKAAGYFLLYLIFTIFLYYALYLTNKLPKDWTVFHVALITLFIVLVGNLLNLMLKK